MVGTMIKKGGPKGKKSIANEHSRFGSVAGGARERIHLAGRLKRNFDRVKFDLRSSEPSTRTILGKAIKSKAIKSKAIRARYDIIDFINKDGLTSRKPISHQHLRRYESLTCNKQKGTRLLTMTSIKFYL